MILIILLIHSHWISILYAKLVSHSFITYQVIGIAIISEKNTNLIKSAERVLAKLDSARDQGLEVTANKARIASFNVRGNRKGLGKWGTSI